MNAPRIGLIWTLVSLIIAPWCFAQSTTPESTTKFKSSLEFVPADVATYIATMNHDALWQSLTNSRALKQLQDSPINKKMRTAYRKRSQGFERLGENPFRHYLEMYANSIDSIPGKSVMPYLENLFRHECFIYANEDLTKLTQAWSTAMVEMQKLGPELQTLGDEPDNEVTRKAMDILDKNFKGLQVPVIVIGALVDEPADFTSLMDLAEDSLSPLLNQVPPEMQFVAEAFQTGDEKGLRYMGFQIVGSELPWEDMAANVDQGTEFVEWLRDFCNDKTMSVSLAVQNNVVMFSFGPSLDHIKNFGKGPLLKNHELFRPIAQAVADGKKLVGAYYNSENSMKVSSETWQATLASLPANLSAIVDAVPEDEMPEVDREQLKKMLVADGAELEADLKNYFGRAGAVVAYAYQSANGIEGEVRNYAENKRLDSSAPLQLKKHLGSNPIAFLLSREKVGLNEYQLLSKYGGKLFGYIMKSVPSAMGDDVGRQEFQQVIDMISSYLSKIDETTAKKLIPNVAGGEMGVALSLAMTRTTLGPWMPTSEHPLPIPSLAIVLQLKTLRQSNRRSSNTTTTREISWQH